jgi:HSP20 family molecular chaperone IbpA
VASTPAVTRADDGTIVFRMDAPHLKEETIQVEHKGEGRFTVSAKASPVVQGHQRTTTRLSIDLKLPAQVDGSAIPKYLDGMLEIRFTPR